MSEKILVPVLGESITEATVSKWLKNEGDSVEADEPLVELETDKVNLEVPSPVSGVLTKINSKNAKRKLKWKIDNKIVGASAVLNEIGTHAYHLASYISGLKGQTVFADIKQISKKIKMDDNAQVMINFNNGAKGMFWTSVMAKGGVYGLRIRVFGSKGSLEWVQNLSLIHISEPRDKRQSRMPSSA